jgi:ATP-binding cassette subfamily F protein uup
LQDILGDYPGTVLLVSHDRDFLDRTATTTIAMEGNGQAVVYAGGWTDYREQRGARTPEAPKSVGKKLSSKGKQGQTVARKTTLSFTEKHRLEELPGVIQSITAEIDKLGQLLADPELFTANPVKFEKATDALGQRQDALDTAEEEWLALEEKAS